MSSNIVQTYNDRNVKLNKLNNHFSAKSEWFIHFLLLIDWKKEIIIINIFSFFQVYILREVMLILMPFLSFKCWSAAGKLNFLYHKRQRWICIGIRELRTLGKIYILIVKYHLSCIFIILYIKKYFLKFVSKGLNVRLIYLILVINFNVR